MRNARGLDQEVEERLKERVCGREEAYERRCAPRGDPATERGQGRRINPTKRAKEVARDAGDTTEAAGDIEGAATEG